MINLTNSQTIYVTSLVIAVVLLLIGTCFYIYKKIYNRKRYHETVYLKLARLAKYNDFLLLNNYRVEYDDTHYGVIDHILIGKKYIYVINDFDLSGVVVGDLKEVVLRNIVKENEVLNISNPLNYNINLIKRINVHNKIDQSLIKGIVVIQNNSDIHIGGNNNQFVMVRQSDLIKSIKTFEQDSVKNLKEGEIVNFINKLDRENRSKV